MFARPCRLEVFAKQAGRKHGLQASINRLQTARGVLAWGHRGRGGIVRFLIGKGTHGKAVFTHEVRSSEQVSDPLCEAGDI